MTTEQTATCLPERLRQVADFIERNAHGTPLTVSVFPRGSVVLVVPEYAGDIDQRNYYVESLRDCAACDGLNCLIDTPQPADEVAA